MLVTGSSMAPGMASDKPGLGASQGQKETGLETGTPATLLGQGLVAPHWAQMGFWATSRAGEKP